MNEERPRPTTLSGGPASTADLRARAETLAGELAQLLNAPEPELSPAFVLESRIDVTGIGASEGPAQLLVAVLLELGWRARFVPASSFVSEQDGREAALIVFSQGLCPNARLALRQASRYQTAVLLTTVTGVEKDGPLKAALLDGFREAGGVVWTHPPAREGGSLVRLVGPACATLAALRLARRLGSRGAPPSWCERLNEVPGAVDRTFDEPRARLDADPAVFLAIGELAPLLPSLCWKWQEGLFAPLPHAIELLSFMHGPLQSLHGRNATLVLCTRSNSTPAELDLRARLERVLLNEPHRLITLESRLPGPLAWFEFDAALNRLLLAELDARGLDPGHWPAQGHDAPLYQVGE